MPRPLTAVPDDGAEPDPDQADDAIAPLGVLAAAESGTSRELLVALRTRIARTIEDPKCPARELAALSRRLLEIAKEIDALDAANGEGDGIGDAASTPDEAYDPDAD